MKKILTSSLLTISVVILTNCASIVGPTHQQVKVDSQPQGAQVFIGGKTVTTPAVVELKGKSEYYVTANKDGYKPASDVLNGEVRILPAVVGNIFNLTGAIGMAVDFFGTGAAYKLDESVNVKLQKS